MHDRLPPSLARIVHRLWLRTAKLGTGRCASAALGALFTAVLAGCSEPAREAPGQPPADLIVVGDHIVTMDDNLASANAVAVRGDEIVAVGNASELLELQGQHTRMIELGEQALLPGFIDAHGHVSFVARLIDFVNLSSPPVGSVQNMDDIVRLLGKRIAERELPAGEWLFGYGYDDSLIAENRHPTRDDLDRASTEHPIALMHVSGHLAAVNSAALAAVGMDGDTADPPGGVIRRRPGSDEPNGVMEETAATQFTMGQFGQVDPQRYEALLRRALDYHASFGITTVQDGGAIPTDVAVMRAAAERKPFPVDVVAFVYVTTLDDDAIASYAHDPEYTGGFRVGGIKFGLDGSPQGRTAWLSEPYTEGPDDAPADYVAYPTYDVDTYKKQVAEMIGRGVPVLVHANGDAAIDAMMEGVTGAVDPDALPDHRSVIIHAQLMRPDQLPTVKALGLVPSYYAAHPFFWGDWHRRSFGEERAAHISPVKATIEHGIPFTVHNDAPVVPPDIMRLVHITVNRTTRSGYVLGPEQRASVKEALYAVTQGAAYQYFEEDTKGSITPGKRADLVILGANPLTADPQTLADIPVVETFVRGRSVFRRSLD